MFVSNHENKVPKYYPIFHHCLIIWIICFMGWILLVASWTAADPGYLYYKDPAMDLFT